MQMLATPTKHVGYVDCWPLVHRMAVLRIDPDEIADEDPLLYCDLRSTCMLCECRAQCEHDLADEAADFGWQAWRDYCPNATTLAMLSAVKASRAHAD